MRGRAMVRSGARRQAKAAEPESPGSAGVALDGPESPAAWVQPGPARAVAGLGGSRTLRALARSNGFEDRGGHRAPSNPEGPFSTPRGIPAARDDEAFRREALVHMESLQRCARRLAGDPREAEDLLQECYARALRFFHNYRQGTNCRAWLFRIMHNLHINRWNARRRSPPLTSLEEAEDHSLYRRLHDPERSREGNPEAEFFASNLAPEVRRALAALSGSFRAPVVLCDVEGLSYGEIAEILEIPVGTVRSRLNRARRRLQGLLQDYVREANPELVAGRSSG